MTTGQPGSEDRATRAVRDCLTDLIAIETRMNDSVERWSDAVRDDPDAAAAIDHVQTTSKSHREALEDRLAVTAGTARPSASTPSAAPVPTESASGALRRAAEAAVAAAFAYEAAYQTARLSADGDTCDLLESHLSDHAATVTAARRLLPHVVARELRRAGVNCVCRCPMCSIGACGCVRATLAAAEVAWGGEEPARTAGLILSSPPRPGSQLAEAGLEEGDVVLSMDGVEVGSNGEAQTALRLHKVGEEVPINVQRRDGARLQVIVRRVG